jgi:hypothetical protein
VKPCLNLPNPETNNFVFFYICRLKKHLPHTKNANLHILLGNNLAALSEYQEALDQYSIGIRYVQTRKQPLDWLATNTDVITTQSHSLLAFRAKINREVNDGIQGGLLSRHLAA